jgi:hypothetical protein
MPLGCGCGALLWIYANVLGAQTSTLDLCLDQAAAFAGYLVLREMLKRHRNFMIHEYILENIIAELYRQAAKLYSKTVAPNYS